MQTAPLKPLDRQREMSRTSAAAINAVREEVVKKLGIDPYTKDVSTTKAILKALEAFAVQIEDLKCLLDDQNDQLGDLRDTVEAL